MYSTHPDTARGFATWGLAAIILVVLAANLPNIGAFFSQDDFAGMHVDASSFMEFKRFFAGDPQGNRAWYRPVSFEIKFWLMREAFGFNPAPHHLLPLLLHCLNIILCYRFLHLLTRRVDVPLLAAALYGLTGAHQTSLYWISAGVEPITAFFYLWGLIAFLSWRENPGAIRGTGVCLLYIIALLCKETAITLPFALLLVNALFPVVPGQPSERRRSGIPWLYIALFVILAAYLFFWISAQYKPGGGELGYQLTKNPFLLTANFFAYLLQVFIGNAIIYAVMTGLGAGNPREFVTGLMQSPLGYILGLLGIGALVLIVVWIRRCWRDFFPHEQRYAFFGFLWLILCILPVLPFPGHNTAYYVNIAMIGFSSCIAGVALGMRNSNPTSRTRRIVGWGLLALYVVNFGVNTHLGAKITPVARRSIAGKAALERMTEMHPSFEPGTLLFILDIDEDLRITLNDGLIFMSFYGDDLRWCFTLKDGQKITRAYLDVHGWQEGGPRIFYSYDGERFLVRDEEYFLKNYPPDGV
jgi:hypothetical protein